MKIIFCRIALAAAMMAAIVLNSAETVRAQPKLADTCISGLTADDCQLLSAALNANYSPATITYSLKWRETGTYYSGITPPSQGLDLSIAGTGPIDFKADQPFDHFDMVALVGNALADQNISYTLEGLNIVAEFRKTPARLFMHIVSPQDSGWAEIGGNVLSITQGIPADYNRLSSLAELSRVLHQPDTQALWTNVLADPMLITAQRAAGDTVNNQATMRYTLTVNPAAFATAMLASDNRALLTKLVTGLYEYEIAPVGVTAQPLQLFVDRAVANLTTTMPAFQTAKFTIMSRVDTQNKQLQCICLDYSDSLDAATATKLNLSKNQPVARDLEFMLEFSNIGQPVSVEPVKNAFDATNSGC